MVAVFALPTMAQPFEDKDNPSIGQNVPDATFQSTSTLRGSGSAYSATPMLNADGTASYEGSGTPTGPRRAPEPISVDEDIPEGGGLNTPVGDGVLPLLALAMAFGGVVYMRRRKAV